MLVALIMYSCFMSWHLALHPPIYLSRDGDNKSCCSGRELNAMIRCNTKGHEDFVEAVFFFCGTPQTSIDSNSLRFSA